MLTLGVITAAGQIPRVPTIPRAPAPMPTPAPAGAPASLRDAPDSDFYFIGEQFLDGRPVSNLRVCAPSMPTAPPVARGFLRWLNGISEADAWRSYGNDCNLVVYGVGPNYKHKNLASLSTLSEGRSIYTVDRDKLRQVYPSGSSAVQPSRSVSSVAPQGKTMLVFSKSPIDPANPSNLTNVFAAGDHIYGLLILDRPLKDFLKEESVPHKDLGYNVTRPAMEIQMKMDGSPIYDGTHYFAWDIENKDTAWDAVPSDRYFIFDVAPDPSNAKTYAYPKVHFEMLSSAGRPGNRARAGAQFYSHKISTLRSGTHKIEFSIIGSQTIRGEFAVTDGNYAFYNQIADKLDEVAAQNALLPTAQRKDPTMEVAIKQAVAASGNRDTILRVSITNPDWFVQRGPLGQILFRGIFAAIAFRKADGTCYYYQAYFKQDHAGGRYGATRQDGRPGPIPMACANVNK